MKFQMAPNSLFAVLLRQPWWVSLVVAAGVGGVGAALSPAEYKGVGLLAGLPFVLLSLVALKQQWGKPSADEIAAVHAQVAAMAWADIRLLLVARFEREGYQVTSLDGDGADLQLARGGRTVLVSARRLKAARLGEETLAALAKAVTERGADSGMCIALAEPTPAALRLLQQHEIALVQGEALARLLRGIATVR